MAIQDWHHHNPVKVYFGPKCRKELAPILAGQHVLVVTTARGRAQLSSDPYLGKLQADITWSDQVNSNPSLIDTQAEIDRLAGQRFGAVLAFGGGSAIDAAKAMAAALTPGATCSDLTALIADPGKNLIRPLLPIYAVATTSGTGAEVTPFATIWDRVNYKKLSMASPHLFPSMAIVDPELTYDLPRSATLCTSLDALNQAFESVWNRNRTPLTMVMAARSIRLAFEAIPRLASDLDDRPARAMIAEASLLAGLCISQTRTAICHSISYPLTAHFGIAHGLACATTMSAVAREVLRRKPDSLDEVAELIGTSNSNALVRQLNDVLRTCDLKSPLPPYFPKRNEALQLVNEMYIMGRSDNFILKVDKDLLVSIVESSFSC